MFSAKKTPSKSVGGYKIGRSLRFNSADSTHLTKTFASTGSTIWTVSCWHKRTVVGVAGTGYHIGIAGRSSSNSDSTINIAGDDLLGWTRNGTFNSTGVYIRDTSAWYHFVTTYDNTNIRMYVNGVLVHTSAVGSLSRINSSTVTQHIGGRGDATFICEGYTAEFYFIDGQALTPSDFGETDSVTGIWKPKKYTGTYGTNGFYLDFSDNSGTTSSTLGKDRSGNNNDWTPNNFSVASGAGNDSVIDSPTQYDDSGTGRGNYCVLNAIDSLTTVTLSNGGLQFAPGSTTNGAAGTFWISSGKWYWEFLKVANGTNSEGLAGVVNLSGVKSTSSWGRTTTDIQAGVRFDADAGTLDYTTNGTSWTSIATGLTSGPYAPWVSGNTGSPTITANFGQQPFVFTPPTGYKALNTFNLPTPTIVKGTDYFNNLLYTGTGSSRSVSGLSFTPDLVWIKSRSAIADHAWYDSLRGVQKDIGSNLATDETTQSTGLTAFNSDGFTVGSLGKVNTNAATYAAWCWKENATPGFDIVTYTGTGVARTIAHNLGAVPKFIIVKARTTAGTDQGWYVYHSAVGASGWLRLDQNVNAQAGTAVWNGVAPTSTVFSVSNDNSTNANGDTYVAYLFAEVPGFSAIGSYTGNGLATGPFVNCGFRPAFVIIKRQSGGAVHWRLVDDARDTLNEATSQVLIPSQNNAEDPSGPIDFLSNGFKVRSTDIAFNASGSPYVYIAFADIPFKYSLAR